MTLFGMVALTVVRLQAASPGIGTALLAGIGLWVYAAWRLTEPFDHPRAASLGLGRQSRLRRAARLLQLAWLLFAVAVPPKGLFILWVAGPMGVAGLVCLVLYLGRIASWVRDDFAEKAFDLSVFGTVLGAGLSLIIRGLGLAMGGFAINFMLVFSLGLTVVSLLAFPVGLLSLSRSVGWSARHARARQARSAELDQRRAPRPGPTPAPTDPIPLVEESADPPHPPSRKPTGTQEQKEAR